MRVLVAGAGGALGRLVVAELEERGCAVRAVVRRANVGETSVGGSRELRVLDAVRPGAWAGVCDGVDVVVSALGASVDPSPLIGRRTYTQVDGTANIALLRESQRAGVRRFVYVSLLGGAGCRELDYAEGHERVVDAMRASGMCGVVLRPTGFFCAMASFVNFAKRGVIPLIGDGSARTNPIDERDLAAIAAEAAVSVEPGLREVEIGGPEEFTRREIVDLAIRVKGRRVRVMSAPVWAARAGGHVLRLLNPRAGHFALFAAHAMTHDCVGPVVGRRRLEEYLQERATKS